MNLISKSDGYSVRDEFAVLRDSAVIVAPRLLGSILEREIDGEILRVKIVEVEAYDQTDPASHSFKGRTSRAAVMFGPAGHTYVYFTYGMHYCCNIVTGEEGYGSGVLIRAAEPLEGLERMTDNRHGRSGRDIANGPAKMCQALQINKQLLGHDLHESPLRLIVQPALSIDEIVQTTRVGISQAKDVPWRFYIRDNPFVSKQ